MLLIALALLSFCYCIYRYNNWCKYHYDYLTCNYNFSNLTSANVYAVINPNSQTKHIWENIMKNPQFVCGHPCNISSELVLCFGGDGTIHKTIQCLHNDQKLLVLPCGSSNGIATSLGIKNRSDALLALSRPPSKIPVMNVIQPQKKSHASALMSVAWGAIADYDFYGEDILRFLGSLRSIVIPVMIIASCKTYQGTVDLVLSSSKRLILSGDFAMVHVVKMPNIAHDVCLDSECDPTLGVLHVFIVREVSRFEMIDIFRNMNSLKNHKCVDMYICSSVTILPQNGNMAMDGEYMPTQITEINGNGKTIQMFTCK
jgi:diacylglycerol kinase family enzyme